MAPQTFVSVLFDHGTDPRAAGYVCGYFPKADATEMPDRVEKFRTKASICAGGAGHRLLWDEYVGFAFFAAGGVMDCGADRACFVAIEDVRQVQRRIAVFEPSFTDCEVTIEPSFAQTSGPLPEGWTHDGEAILVPCSAGIQAEGELAVVR